MPTPSLKEYLRPDGTVDVERALIHERQRRVRQFKFKEKVRARRLGLIETLGGRCVQCDEVDENRLQIDHAGGGRQWEVTKHNQLTRITRYWKEYHAGVPLRVLCIVCNGWDGATRQHSEARRRRLAQKRRRRHHGK